MVDIADRQVDKQSCRGNSELSSHRGGTWVIRVARLFVRAPSLYDVPTILSRCDVRYDVVASNDCTRTGGEVETVARVGSADLRRRGLTILWKSEFADVAVVKRNERKGPRQENINQFVSMCPNTDWDKRWKSMNYVMRVVIFIIILLTISSFLYCTFKIYIYI